LLVTEYHAEHGTRAASIVDGCCVAAVECEILDLDHRELCADCQQQPFVEQIEDVDDRVAG